MGCSAKKGSPHTTTTNTIIKAKSARAELCIIKAHEMAHFGTPAQTILPLDHVWCFCEWVGGGLGCQNYYMRYTCNYLWNTDLLKGFATKPLA